MILDNITANVFQNMVDASPNPIYYCSGEEMIVSVANSATLKAWGKDTTVLGLPFLEALPEMKEQPFFNLLTQVYKTGISYYASKDRADILINGQLQSFYFDFTYQAIKDEKGNITGVVCYATDVTGLEKARQESERNKNILYNIVKQAPVGICIIKGDPFHVQLINDTFLQLTGKQETDFQNKSYWDAIPEIAPFYEPISKNVVSTGETYYAQEHEITLIRNGIEEIIYANFVYQPIKDFDGSSDTIVIVVTEVTEQVNARHNLQRLNDELVSAIEEEAAANEELVVINEELQQMQEQIQNLNNELENNVAIRTQELAFLNEELASSNEDLAISNDELAALNEELKQTQENLLDLNDLLEEKVLERTKDLSESEERFRTMAESSGILITVGDEYGNEIYYSRAWVELTGRSLEKLLYFGWKDLIHPEDKEVFLGIYYNAFKNHLPFSAEFRLLDSEGQYKWLLANGNPRFRFDNSFAGYISSSVDITELKKDEERKNAFIGMVSHELKTPLTTLNGYIQIMQGKAHNKNDAFNINALNTANKQVKKMITMINGFLNISRLESGKILLDKTTFQLHTLIENVISETTALDASHNINLKNNQEIEVYADYDKISNVISNLLSNAIKYAPNSKDIEVDYGVVNGMIQVSVKDYGMGIKNEDIKQLFERFFRVEGNHTISGFGIGLYLSAEIIARHDGNIWVESEIGQGSTFYFNLPIQ
jgi:PAS domain S-box-containing protein